MISATIILAIIFGMSIWLVMAICAAAKGQFRRCRQCGQWYEENHTESPQPGDISRITFGVCPDCDNINQCARYR